MIGSEKDSKQEKDNKNHYLLQLKMFLNTKNRSLHFVTNILFC